MFLVAVLAILGTAIIFAPRGGCTISELQKYLPTLPEAVSLPANPQDVNSGRAQNALFHKVNIIGDENRQTIYNFARTRRISVESLKKQFSATGMLVCRPTTELYGPISTVQFVLDRNILLLSAHALWAKKNDEQGEKICALDAIGKPRHVDLRHCVVRLLGSNETLLLDTNALFIGSECAKGQSVEAWSNDYAVLRTRTCARVDPYPLYDQRSSRLGLSKTSVLNVMGPPNIVGAEYHNRTFVLGRCSVKAIERIPFHNSVFVSDCSADPGTSGSGIFVGGKDGSEKLVGVVSATGTEILNGAPYDPKQFSATYGPLVGNRMIEKINSLRNGKCSAN